MKSFGEIIKILPSLGQIGLSIVVPVVFCILLCSWLTNVKGVGLWVYIPGFIFGIGGSAASAMKIYRNKKKETDKKDRPVAFNRHI